jgi:hypothetical protein
VFTIRGLIEDGDGEVSVSWFPLGPDRLRARPKNGDLVRRAIIDEVEGRTFRAKPTGPFFHADLDNPKAALVQLTSSQLER